MIECQNDQQTLKGYMMKKVWIELPKVKTMGEAQEHCDAVNSMLRRLGVTYDVFWATDNQRHCSTFYNANEGPGGAGYTECSDRGKWFNLDFLATETA